jgi:EAL domain-containing protein (putative c-di-GMP-specific phosphodiesterase class I)
MGKGGYAFYSQELSERQHRRMSLATMLHKAIEEQEFVLHYQPIVDLKTGKLVGVEALIRWCPEEGTVIPPADFLPVAEDMGLIIPIGEWVMDEACRQLKRWCDAGTPLYVAINLSVRQLWHSDVVSMVMDTIQRTGIDRSLLELEVTESAMTVDPVRMEGFLAHFDQHGIRISLDDFGTGYSSLNRLKHLPIHTLKIDQSFVDGVPDDDDDVAIVTATIQLARSLGLRSLAEGIETATQWQWLLEAGCEFGQGFQFSQAVPPEEITALLAQGDGWSLTGLPPLSDQSQG